MIKELSNYMRFQRARLGGKIVCPERPHFENDKCTARFEELMRQSDVYLEYGSGGSSILGASLGKKIFSVDSDWMFQKQVRKTLAKCNFENNAQLTLIYANIGMTREWGVPLSTKCTPGRLRKWRRYAVLPWDIMRVENLSPDLVLIDGRFRVACALESLKNLNANSDAKILFDDYFEREHYSVVEQFGDLIEKVGRMAVFKPKSVDPEKIASTLAEYSADWR